MTTDTTRELHNSYARVLNIFEAMPRKELGSIFYFWDAAGNYESDTCLCCAVGAIVRHYGLTELFTPIKLRTQGISFLSGTDKIREAGKVMFADIPVNILMALQTYNDGCNPDYTDAERYTKVVGWVKGKLADIEQHTTIGAQDYTP